LGLSCEVFAWGRIMRFKNLISHQENYVNHSS